MRFLNSNKIFCICFSTLLSVCSISFAFSNRDSSGKKELTIAFIFPFNTATVYIGDLGQSKYYFPDETQIAVEFLQGAMLAIDSLKQRGLNARVLIYDCGNDSTTIENVLREPDVKEANLLLAPFNGYALKKVNEFASLQQIPVVSPLSVSFSDSSYNHFLILANASMKMHCERMYDYMLTQALTHRTLMIYRKQPQDLEVVKYIHEYVAQKKKEGLPTMKFIELTDSTKTTFWKLRDSLFATDVNQILIPSNDEPFVRTLLKQLSNLQDKYKMRVYGMPTWNSFELIPGAQFDSLNTVITSSIWLDKSSLAVDNFKNKYSVKYGVNPSEYSVRGFDEAFYFISQLMETDSLIPHLATSPTISMIATSYNFSPIKDQGSDAFLENNSLFLLGRSEGRWIRLKN